MNSICAIHGNLNIHILTEKENLITLSWTSTTRMEKSFSGFDFQQLLIYPANLLE